MPRFLPPVAQNVRRLRNAKGWSQAALGRAAGIAAAHVSMIESGRRADPQGSVLQALAGALGVTVDELLRPAPTETTVLEDLGNVEAARGDPDAAADARKAPRAARRAKGGPGGSR